MRSVARLGISAQPGGFDYNVLRSGGSGGLSKFGLGSAQWLSISFDRII